MLTRRFMLKPHTAYAYQMVPGYGGGNYYSPIIVHAITPLRRGDGSFMLDFTNCFYAEGVQGMRKEFQMLHHTETHLAVADRHMRGRTIIISELNQNWLDKHCDGRLLSEWVNAPDARHDETDGNRMTMPDANGLPGFPPLAQSPAVTRVPRLDTGTHSRLRDRFRGALFGLAVGDVLGVPVEFKAPGSFEPVRDVLGGGVFNLLPGEWTDDTSMALCLAESLLACQGFDAVDQLKRYVAWWREGHLSSKGYCFDIGNTVQEALAAFERHQTATVGVTHDYSAGNGSLMRLVPVPLFYHQTPERALELAALSSRTTHAHPAAVDACRYYAGLIVGALQGEHKDTLLSSRYTPISGYYGREPLTPAIDAIASGSFKHKQPPEIQGRGYVVQSLEAALWAFYNSDNFEEGCQLAVNLGWDADTTGAIFGQLAGAYYGECGIPARWRGTLVQSERIGAFADALLEAACQPSDSRAVG